MAHAPPPAADPGAVGTRERPERAQRPWAQDVIDIGMETQRCDPAPTSVLADRTDVGAGAGDPRPDDRDMADRRSDTSIGVAPWLGRKRPNA